MVASAASSAPDLRTTGAALLLAVVLVAYTIQTELASYVQHQLGYRKPFFLFYLTHSGYTFLLPVHLLVLRLLGTPIRATCTDLRHLLAHHFRDPTPLDEDGLPTSPKRSRARPERSLYHDPSRSALASAVLARLPTRWAEAIEPNAPWLHNLATKAGQLTVFISAPALSWYAAVPLTSMTDITAIYNVFAFWAYLLSLFYLPTPASAHESPSTRLFNLFSVVLAVAGVLVIAYGDAAPTEGGGDDGAGANRLIGNALAFFGSVAYAAYEVWYKIHIALPDAPSEDQPLTPILPVHQRPTLSSTSSSWRRPLLAHAAASSSSGPHPAGSPDPLAAAIDELDATPRVPIDDHDEEGDDDGFDDKLGGGAGMASETSSLLGSPAGGGTPTRTGSPRPGGGGEARSAAALRPTSSVSAGGRNSAAPPPRATPTLYLLYSNLLTSLIGVCTLLFLWIPIPLLQLLGWEEFEWPPVEARVALAGIIAAGVVFNGGFMLLISLLGPVIASVANLLTLLLVAAADALFVPSAPPITRATVLGGGMIVAAFAGLIAGEVRAAKREQERARDRGG